jgi:hypothetical protein
MNNDSQLLCTFSNVDAIEDVVENIVTAYNLTFNKIYVLENIHDLNQIVLTYNVSKIHDAAVTPPPSTISVHRKKHTNTIYTINAINKLIEMKNDGVLDKSFRINWDELKNTVLVTAYNKLKVVNTKLLSIIEY